MENNIDFKNLTEEEWQKRLTPQQYRILRQAATELPFTGTYDQEFGEGTYRCSACNQQLFASSNKYDSKCGWPAFDEALPDAVTFHTEDPAWPGAIEVKCGRCESHLGHIFEDGPEETTGQRYCINSASLHLNQGE